MKIHYSCFRVQNAVNFNSDFFEFSFCIASVLNTYSRAKLISSVVGSHTFEFELNFGNIKLNELDKRANFCGGTDSDSRSNWQLFFCLVRLSNNFNLNNLAAFKTKAVILTKLLKFLWVGLNKYEASDSRCAVFFYVYFR